MFVFVFSVKRVREKYEAELRELERSEQVALEKHQEMKKKQSEMEGEILRLQSLLTQREQEITDVTQVNEARLNRQSTLHTTQITENEHTRAGSTFFSKQHVQELLSACLSHGTCQLVCISNTLVLQKIQQNCITLKFTLLEDIQ